MYGFCSDVLRPEPSFGTHGDRRERARDRDEDEQEEGGRAAEDRGQPRQQVLVALAAAPDGEAREAGQDEPPEQQRARLRAPERRELVDGRERARGVVGDLLEAEVVAQDRDPEHDRRGQHGRERGEDRARRGGRDAPIAVRAGPPARARCEGGGEQSEDQRAAAEKLHLLRSLGGGAVARGLLDRLLRRRVLRRAAGAERVLHGHERRALELAVHEHGAARAERVGPLAVVQDLDAARRRPCCRRA